MTVEFFASFIARKISKNSHSVQEMNTMECADSEQMFGFRTLFAVPKNPVKNYFQEFSY